MLSICLDANSFDLTTHMSTGNAPNTVFGHDNADTPNIDTHMIEGTAAGLSSLEPFIRLVDVRLRPIYLDLMQTVSKINEGVTRDRPLHYSAFEPTLSSIIHRLQRLKEQLDGPRSESFRLGLLAFLAVAFFEAPNTARAKSTKQFAYLTSSLRISCRAVESLESSSTLLEFWVLTVGAASVFGPEDDCWLVERWNWIAKTLPGALLSWRDARQHLEGVLWIRSIHDDLGKTVYTELIRKGSSNPI